MKNSLETVNPARVYNRKIRAVDKANVSIREGEIFGLLGPNSVGQDRFDSHAGDLHGPTSGRARGRDAIRFLTGFNWNGYRRGTRRVWGFRIYRDHDGYICRSAIWWSLKRIHEIDLGNGGRKMKTEPLVAERQTIAKETVGRADTSGAQTGGSR